MSTSIDDALAVEVAVDGEELRVRVHDGRTITVPLSRFPRLSEASPAERDNWSLIGRGQGIHWPLIDEDLSIAALLRGR